MQLTLQHATCNMVRCSSRCNVQHATWSDAAHAATCNMQHGPMQLTLQHATCNMVRCSSRCNVQHATWCDASHAGASRARVQTVRPHGRLAHRWLSLTKAPIPPSSRPNRHRPHPLRPARSHTWRQCIAPHQVSLVLQAWYCTESYRVLHATVGYCSGSCAASVGTCRAGAFRDFCAPVRLK
jgi:hypothetical protein